MVRVASGTSVEDAPSGFRAISREAALQLNVFSDYTYTLEMIIQAGRRNMAITSVPIRTNPDLRPSRLVKSVFHYVKHSTWTILRIFLVYKPLRFFALLGSLPLAVSFLLGVRWLVLRLTQTGPTHVPSLILAAILALIGFQLWVFGFVADLMAVNRRMLEDIQMRTRRQEHANHPLAKVHATDA